MSKQWSTASVKNSFSKFVQEHELDEGDPNILILQHHLLSWVKDGVINEVQYEEDLKRLSWKESLELIFSELLYSILPLQLDESLEDLPTQAANESIQDESGQAKKAPAASRESVDSFKTYCAEVRQYKPLDAQGSMELSKVYHQGKTSEAFLKENGPQLNQTEIQELKQYVHEGEKALMSLIHGNLWLSISIAKRYFVRGFQRVDIMDLIQEGSQGIMEAAKRYDPTKNTIFASYAVFWVKKFIRSFLAENQMIRVPQGVYEDTVKVARAAATILSESGKTATVDQLADRTNLKPRRIKSVLSIRNTVDVISTQTPAKSEESEDDFTLEATLSDRAAEADFKKMENEDMYSILIREMKKVLTPIEVKVLILRFGLEDQTTYPLEIIGMELGYEKERIRQIQEKAKDKMKQSKSFADFFHSVN